jgi:hypothetical protein
MRQALKLPMASVTQQTGKAFAPGLTDQARIDALSGIPGFGSGGAFEEFGVFDSRASKNGWPKVITPACVCQRTHLPVYFDHLRQLATELGPGWTPRMVDIALYEV